MNSYIAFLRGINVGGVKLKSTDQKKLFEEAGFTHVETVLATGNIIFSASENQEIDLSFLPVDAFFRSRSELKTIIDQAPFPSVAGRHLYVFIGRPGFADLAQANFDRLKKLDELGKTVGDTFYWQVPLGLTLATPFAKILGKKEYQSLFTSRNMNTLNRVMNKIA